ncbi:MAG: efflux RND transporter permease subunit [Methylobacteriaceae bacterium]|nr:efflux RND transporter permease subunit [Methylobacteriaceae bacterium]
MTFSHGFIRRPIATSLLSAAILLIGAVAYPLLPVAPLPQVDFPTVQVSANLPGASPETMASNVATPLERQFSLIAGLTEMTSTSTAGSTQITLQFELNRNIDGAAQDTQAAINAASGQLPTNLPSPPTYRKVNPADAPIMVIAMTSDALPLTVVDDYADNIMAQQLSQISGVGLVFVGGAQKPAVRIQLDPAKIASMGLGLEEIRAQVANATVNAPKGTIDAPAQSFTVYTDDQVLSAAKWNNIVVAYRAGAPVRVRDIGTAIDGAENTKLAAWAGSKRAILLPITKQPGANVIDTVNRVRAALPRLTAMIPQSIDTQFLVDRTQTIRSSVADVQFTLMLTICLVVMVIFVFLRNVTATVIPSVTVPLALLGTTAVMYLVGYSIDNLSLMALTIAVGFVVDDAIVMLENIYRHVEAGMRPLEAALKGSAEIGFTIISISVSLIAVFIPVLLMGGIIGRLLREFAMTVTITILVSVIVSLTLTPTLCALFLKSHSQHRQARGIGRLLERFFAALQSGYERSLRVVLRHQFAALMVFFATVAATVCLYLAIPKGFFPQQDTGFIYGQAEGAQDISFSGMTRRVQDLARIVNSDPDVNSVGYVIGGQTFNTGNFFINLRTREDGRTASADQIIARLRAKIAGIEGINLFMQVPQDIRLGGRLSRTQYQYTLTDADLGELNAWAPKLMDAMGKLPNIIDLASDQQTNASTAVVSIDRDQAARFGIQPQLIDATIYDAVGQRQVAQFFTQLNSYHVVLEVSPRDQADPNLFERLYLTSPVTGGQVPLKTLVNIDTTKTNYLSISHQSQFPAVTLSFNLRPGFALGDAVDAILKTKAAIGAPATLNGAFQGTAQAFQSSLATQPYLIAAALVAVYIILGVLYESYVHPLTILSTLPSAGVGALLILMGAGYDLSVIALIGILLLIGIVKKNGIMMIDFALHGERERGLKPIDSIFEACLLRFRPIMMTTMCALLSGVPLMVGAGTGSEIRRPLGFAMVGGLALSQVLTLYTTPVVYLYLERLRQWLGGRSQAARRAERPEAAASGAPDMVPVAAE